ncbi:electron transfer flavoprotein subunit alpha/FixB family protein [soil metagenome]
MILFVADHVNGKLKKSALELVTAAGTVADGLGGEPIGVVLGGDVSAVAQELSSYVAKVVAVEDAALADMRAEPYAAVVATLAQDLGAKAVLVSASKSGLSYSPRVAVRLDAPLLEDVTSLSVQDGAVVATRFSYLSRVTETVKALGTPVVVSVKPNVLPAATGDVSGSVETKSVTIPPEAQRVTVGERAAAKSGRVALDEANIVVTGGRGVGGPEAFTNLIEPLADVMNAGVGSTRAVVDAGWRPYGEQVGQTGKTVSPDVYFALGVSGAVQHLSGMNRSKLIVAVNKDADAPIFKVADYGVVGDVNTVLPALQEALQAQKG